MTPILILLSNMAHAWVIKTNNSGQNLHWNKSDIHYSINANGTHGLSVQSVENAITNAAGAWSHNDLNMIYDGDTKKTGADYSDEVHSIVFKDNWTEDPSVLAITYTWSTTNGEIVHFDMEINAEDHDWSTTGESNKQDLMNAITHEFGHVVGLDHSEELEATMAPDTQLGETNKRDLHQDDLNGFEHLYNNSQGGSTGSGNGNGNTSSSGGGVSGQMPNNHGQTGKGMVPLNNAGCASLVERPGSGLWAILFGFGIAVLRKRV